MLLGVTFTLTDKALDLRQDSTAISSWNYGESYGLMRSNEISEAERKDEMDKTRKLTMGILGRRADTELELNEKRWMPKMKRTQLKESWEITKNMSADVEETFIYSTGSLEAWFWQPVKSPHKKSTKKPLKPQLKLLSFCRSLSPWRGRHLIKYVQPFGAKTHHCCHWSKVTSPDRTIQKSLNRERGLVWSTDILVYRSLFWRWDKFLLL